MQHLSHIISEVHLSIHKAEEICKDIYGHQVKNNFLMGGNVKRLMEKMLKIAEYLDIIDERAELRGQFAE